MSTVWLRDPRVMAVGEPIAVFALTRVGLLGVSSVGRLLLAPSGEAARGVIYGWTNWDAWWYVTIAVEGYRFDPTHQSNVAFFPLYPLLIRAILPLVGNPFVAGLGIAYASFAAALVLIYSLVRDRFGSGVARRAILLLACFPFAYFYSALYTEAAFLALAALAFWLAEREQWWLAGCAGALCAATRFVGVALAPALLLTYAQRRGLHPGKVGVDVASVAIVPVGFLVFALFTYRRFNDPLLMLRTSDAWGVYSPIRQGFGRLDPSTFVPGNFDLVFSLNLLVAIVWLIATVPVVRCVGLGYGAFVFLGTLIPLIEKVDSLGRYVAVLFPVFIVLARWLPGRSAFNLCLMGSVLLLSLLTVLFTNGYRVF